MEAQRGDATCPSHTAKKWQSQDSNPDSLALEPMFSGTPQFWLGPQLAIPTKHSAEGRRDPLP